MVSPVCAARIGPAVRALACAGTGKTLLARAVANRTDACFIRVIGSELVQKYVGEGARMVRELFQARTQPSALPFKAVKSCAEQVFQGKQKAEPWDRGRS